MVLFAQFARKAAARMASSTDRIRMPVALDVFDAKSVVIFSTDACGDRSTDAATVPSIRPCLAATGYTGIGSRSTQAIFDSGSNGFWAVPTFNPQIKRSTPTERLILNGTIAAQTVAKRAANHSGSHLSRRLRGRPRLVSHARRGRLKGDCSPHWLPHIASPKTPAHCDPPDNQMVFHAEKMSYALGPRERFLI